MYPIKLKPIYDKTIWANHNLTDIRGVEETGYGTCWEVSAHPYCQNEIINGEYKGMDLLTLINKYPYEMLGKHTLKDMLRLAYLDAKDDLSIQVHPYEEYAMQHDQDHGKTESWYVLDAKEGATLVAGTKIDDKEVIRKAIEDGTLEKYLNKVPIEKGDFIFIDAGMLHALGGGIFAIEVGTNSNTTYRFYDYKRKDKNGNERELHLEKSFDVVDLSKKTQKVSSPFVKQEETTNKVLCECDKFTVEIYDVVEEVVLNTNQTSFQTITFVSADGQVEYQGEIIDCKYCDTLFIPNCVGEYKIKGTGRILLSYIK